MIPFCVLQRIFSTSIDPKTLPKAVSQSSEAWEKRKAEKESFDLPPNSDPAFHSASTFIPTKDPQPNLDSILKYEKIPASKRKSFSDHSIRGHLSNQLYRFSAINNLKAISTAQERFGFSPDETQILGQLYSSAQLLASFLTGEERIKLTLFNKDTGVPLSMVQAIQTGEIVGPLFSNALDSKGLLPQTTLLHIEKALYNQHQPFESLIELSPDQDISTTIQRFFEKSEGIPSFVHTSTSVDDQGKVIGSGGIVVQTMPDYDPQDWAEMQSKFTSQFDQNPLSDTLSNLETSLYSVLNSIFPSDSDLAYDPSSLRRTLNQYYCSCSPRDVSHNLRVLPISEIEDILAKAEPLDVKCEMCNEEYQVPLTTIDQLLEEKSKD